MAYSRDLAIPAMAGPHQSFVACPMGLSVARPMGLSVARPMGLSVARPKGLSEAIPTVCTQAASNHRFVACHPTVLTLSAQAHPNH